MSSIGSLKYFLPDLSDEKPLISLPITANQSFRSVSVKKSAKSLNITSNLSISNYYKVTSKGGYNFSNPIIQTQKRILSQTSRSVRPAPSLKKSPSKVLQTTESSEHASNKKNSNKSKNPINIFEENIRHELQMRNSHYLVRTMKKLKVEEELGGNSYKSQSNPNRLSTLALSLMNLSKNSSIEGKKEKISKYRPVNLTTAKEKLHQFRVNSWVCKNVKNRRKSLEFYKFILDFFEEIDSEKTGVMPGEKLVESLVFLGLASDPSVIRKTLCLIYKCQDLKSLKIRVKDFTELFKNDPKTDKILEKLDNSCRELKVKIENGKFEGSKGFLASQSSGFASTGFIRRKEELVTINEHLEMIDKWWKRLDEKMTGSVVIDSVLTFFCELKIAQDKNESKSLVVSQVGNKKVLFFDEFQQIFAKPMLKAALLNLSKRLSNEQFVGQDLSQGLKLQSYQKSLLMSGIRCKTSAISEEEGEKALKAIEKYNHQTGKAEKKTFEEIKEGMLKILGLSEIDYIRKRKLLDEREISKPSEPVKEINSKSFDFSLETLKLASQEPTRLVSTFYFEPSEKALNNIQMSEKNLCEESEESCDYEELESPTLDKQFFRRETFMTYKADEKFLKKVKMMLQSKKKSANDSQFLRKYQMMIKRTEK